MATDRDEQLRQQQELEEIRRSFAEMGARMGSLFEPAEIDQEASPAETAQPAPQAAAPAIAPDRPRWWAAAVLTLVFLAGGLIGFILPRSQSDTPDSPSPSAAVTTGATTANPPTTVRQRTRVVVPEQCLETAELADEVIARLNRNLRDNRLALALKDYTVASQACRREASP